jgi:hypothetical protein
MKRPVSKFWTAPFESETTNASNQQRIAKKYPDAQLMNKNSLWSGFQMSGLATD